MKFEPKHWIVLAGLLGGMSTQLLTAHSWSDTLTPGFVAGLMISLSSGITGLFVNAPSGPKDEK